MAAYWTTKGKMDLASGGVQVGTRVFRLLLVTSAGIPANAAAAENLNFVSEVTANECTFTNYARQTITMSTPSEDDTNDRSVIDATDPSVYTSAGGATNNTIGGAWLYRRVGGVDADASDILWVFLGLAGGNITTNGGNITLTFHATNGVSLLA